MTEAAAFFVPLQRVNFTQHRPNDIHKLLQNDDVCNVDDVVLRYGAECSVT